MTQRYRPSARRSSRAHRHRSGTPNGSPSGDSASVPQHLAPEMVAAGPRNMSQYTESSVHSSDDCVALGNNDNDDHNDANSDNEAAGLPPLGYGHDNHGPLPHTGYYPVTTLSPGAVDYDSPGSINSLLVNCGSAPPSSPPQEYSTPPAEEPPPLPWRPIKERWGQPPDAASLDKSDPWNGLSASPDISNNTMISMVEEEKRAHMANLIDDIGTVAGLSGAPRRSPYYPTEIHDAQLHGAEAPAGAGPMDVDDPGPGLEEANGQWAGHNVGWYYEHH